MKPAQGIQSTNRLYYTPPHMTPAQVAGKYDYSVLVSLGLGSAVYLAIKTVVR